MRFLPDARQRFPDQPEPYFGNLDGHVHPAADVRPGADRARDRRRRALRADCVPGGAARVRSRARGHRLIRIALEYAFVAVGWVAGMAGVLAGAALFGGSPLSSLFWLTLGVVAAIPLARPRTPLMSRLRIVHAIARLNVGGAALHVLQLAREQERRGHDVLVVAGTLAAGEESMEYVARELGVDVYPAPRASAGDLAARRPRRDPRPAPRSSSRAGLTSSRRTLEGGGDRTDRGCSSRGARRPRAVVHTYHGHVLRATSTTAASASSG